MATLTDRHRAFLVDRMATFDNVSTALRKLRETFGAEADGVTTWHVAYYDPTNTTGGLPAKKWQARFWAVREGYLASARDTGAYHQRHRIRKLAEYAEAEEGRGNYRGAAGHLEQIAKELGGSYTNRHLLIHGDPRDELAKLLGVKADDLPEVAILADAPLPPNPEGA